MASFISYIQELRNPPAEPDMEPDLDDIDEKADRKLREEMDLSEGAIRKGMLELGEGTQSPRDGDLVHFHLSVKKEDGIILETTRLDEDGSGVPKAFVLGKGRRAPRGWELALYEMLKGERAAFKFSPEYSYAQKGCEIPPPAGIPGDAALLFDIHLVNWYPAKSVKVAGESGVVFKRSLGEADSWESPRPPFDVEVSLSARVPSSSGRHGEGTPYFTTPPGRPLRWTLGSGRTAAYFEEGVCSLGNGERAFLSCPAEEPGTESLIPPAPSGAERVEYEVELHDMVQVRDLTGTGEVTKRRVKDGIGEFPIDCPLEDNAVRAHYKGYLPDSGKVFFDSRGHDGNAPPLEFDTGVDIVPEAVDMCIRLMTPQEVATVRSSPKFAYEGRTDRPLECPEGVEVEFEVELVGFEKTPHWHSMTGHDKVRRAQELKEQGNRTFKAGRLDLARLKYLKALKLVDHAFDIETDEQAELASTIKASCLANVALICQKEGLYTECFQWCDKALREQPGYSKALYRRGTTHALLGDYAQAEADLLQAKEADPSAGGDIDREIARMRQRQRAAASKEREQFKSFFDRGKL